MHQRQLPSSLKKRPEGITNCEKDGCTCSAFVFVPQRPEEVNEWWLPRRKGFIVKDWRLNCECKHDHTHHSIGKTRECVDCSCSGFKSNAQCVACDEPVWQHTTEWETESERRKEKKPVGVEYQPLLEAPNSVRQAVGLTPLLNGPDGWDEFSVPPSNEHLSENEVLSRLQSIRR